jgi:hypothetical protein
MFARASINFVGKFAAPAGFPVIVPQFRFLQGTNDQPVDLTGMLVKFRLISAQGDEVLLLTPQSGLTVAASEGRVYGTSEGIAHTPIAAGTYQYELTIYAGDGEPLRQVYGAYEFVTVRP